MAAPSVGLPSLLETSIARIERKEKIIYGAAVGSFAIALVCIVASLVFLALNLIVTPSLTITVGMLGIAVVGFSFFCIHIGLSQYHKVIAAKEEKLLNLLTG